MEGTLNWPLERAALLFGDNEALVQGDVRRTWCDVADRVAHLGAGLIELGVETGHRVAVLAANDSRYFELAHAVPRGGAVLNALTRGWLPPSSSGSSLIPNLASWCHPARRDAIGVRAARAGRTRPPR